MKYTPRVRSERAPITSAASAATAMAIGQAMFPDLAYVILFLPMLLILVLRPQGLFGRVVS